MMHRVWPLTRELARHFLWAIPEHAGPYPSFVSHTTNDARCFRAVSGGSYECAFKHFFRLPGRAFRCPDQVDHH